MNRKLFVLAALFFFLLFSSCSQPAEKETFDGVACPVEKIQWGMSIQESLDALGVAEEDAELKTQQSGETEKGKFQSADIMLPGMWEVYGYPAQVTLGFYEQYQDLQPGLISITLDYGTEIDESSLQASLKEQVSSYAVNRNTRWESEKTLAEMPQDIVIEYFALNEQNSSEWAQPLGAISFEPKEVKGKTIVSVNNLRAVVLKKAKVVEKTEG